MPTVDTGRGRIAYDIQGSGSPLVMSPGLGGSRHAWSKVAPLLARRHTVITYDHVGTGESGRRAAPHDVGAMAEDVVGLLQALTVGPVDFVGHALGAAIGLELAGRARWPVKRLVLAAGFAAPDPYMRRCLELRKGILERQGVEAFCAAAPLFLFPGWWINENADTVDAKIREAVANFPGHDIALARSDGLLSFSAESHLAVIDQPTLVIASANDGFTSSRTSHRLSERMKQAGFVQMPDGGHVAAELFPDAFADLVLEFLGRGNTA